jgi:hypothetical protein
MTVRPSNAMRKQFMGHQVNKIGRRVWLEKTNTKGKLLNKEI